MPGPGRQRAGALSIWAASCAVVAAVAAALLLAIGTTLAAMRVGIFLGLLAALLLWFAGRERAIIASHTEHELLRSELAAMAVQLQQIERSTERVVAEQGEAVREDLSRLGWSQQSGLRRQEELLRDLGRLLPGGAPLPHEATPSDGIEIPAEVAAAPDRPGTTPVAEPVQDEPRPVSVTRADEPSSPSQPPSDPPSGPAPAARPSTAMPPAPESPQHQEAPGMPYAPPASYLPDSRAEDGTDAMADTRSDVASAAGPAARGAASAPGGVQTADPPAVQEEKDTAQGEKKGGVAAAWVWPEHARIDLTDGAQEQPVQPDPARHEPTQQQSSPEHAAHEQPAADLSGLEPADDGFSVDWLPNIDHLPPIEPHGRYWRE